MRRGLAGTLLVGCVALNARTPHAWSDSAFSVRLGERLIHGHLVGFSGVGQLVHTPHPGAILLSAPLALLGYSQALAAYGLLAGIAFAALVYFVYRLGSTLAGPPAGVLAVLLGALTPHVVLAARDTIDVPFAALVVSAVYFAVQQRTRTALIGLVLAGLLRPEAWVLALFYAFGWRSRFRTGLLLALLAPIVWLLFGLLTTGDPLVALHTTRTFVEQGRYRLPNPFLSIANLIGVPVFLLGIGGAAFAGRDLSRPRLLVAGSATVLAAATFGEAIVGKLAVFDRFLLPSAVLLAVLAAVTTVEALATLRPRVVSRVPRWVRRRSIVAPEHEMTAAV